jgi:hypothetical protein
MPPCAKVFEKGVSKLYIKADDKTLFVRYYCR